MATPRYNGNYGNNDSESESDYETNMDSHVQPLHRYNLSSTAQQQGHVTGTGAEGSAHDVHQANDDAEESFEVIVLGNHDAELYPQNFTCGVCYELMVDPTTLQCGHSFCRHCLATWCVSAQKHQCPSCRQSFSGLPKVSFNLRSTIQSELPALYARRENSVSTVDSIENIRKFEQQFSAIETQQLSNLLTLIMQAQRLQPQRAPASFRDHKAWVGVAIIAVLSITVWTGFGWLLGGAHYEPMTNKQMKQWTEVETSQWLSSLGPWAEISLVEKFAELHIDGVLLAVLNEDDLTKMTHELDALYKRALIRERDDVLMYGKQYKPRPTDFWQFKEAYLFKTLFASDYVQGMPRTLIFYLWLFDYEEGFLPLLHTLLPEQSIDYTDHTQKLPSPTLGQWFSFSWRALFLPHIGIFLPLVYTTMWTSNFVTSLWFMASLTVCAVSHTLNLVMWYFMPSADKTAQFKLYCNTIVGGAIVYTSVYMLWNFIPSFIINLFFYFNFCCVWFQIFAIIVTIKVIQQLATN